MVAPYPIRATTTLEHDVFANWNGERALASRVHPRGLITVLTGYPLGYTKNAVCYAFRGHTTEATTETAITPATVPKATTVGTST